MGPCVALQREQDSYLFLAESALISEKKTTRRKNAGKEHLFALFETNVYLKQFVIDTLRRSDHEAKRKNKQRMYSSAVRSERDSFSATYERVH